MYFVSAGMYSSVLYIPGECNKEELIVKVGAKSVFKRTEWVQKHVSIRHPPVSKHNCLLLTYQIYLCKNETDERAMSTSPQRRDDENHLY